jgi:hypothetical protein
MLVKTPEKCEMYLEPPFHKSILACLCIVVKVMLAKLWAFQYNGAMTSALAIPPDSRYIPFTQQTSCCVPTCIQMVMYKLGIPLLPAEEIGYHLGLTVHPDKSYLFYNVRTSTKPPFCWLRSTNIQTRIRAKRGFQKNRHTPIFLY